MNTVLFYEFVQEHLMKTPQRWAGSGLLVVVMICLIGCGGDGGVNGSNTTKNLVSDKVVASVLLAEGNNQIATVGTELSNPLVVLILNKAGQPIVGQIVNFAVTAGNGTVFAGTSMSDATGYARERWRLGTSAGTNKVEVRVVDANGAAVVFATFVAVGTAGAPQTASIVSGNNQSAKQLKQLPLPVKVIIKDSYSNPIAGVAVTFTANNGSTAFPVSATTDTSGEAAATWTLGTALGSQELLVDVAGISSLTFTALATQAAPGAATTIAKVSGDSQTVTQHALISQSLQVAVTDVLGNPVPNSQVTFSAATSGSSYNNPAVVSTDSNGFGKASWTGYFHTAGQHNVTVSGAGLNTVNFTINVTETGHPYDGTYLFGITDSSPSMVITNGALISDGWLGFRGTLNEVDGTFSAVTGGLARTCYSGQLIIDPLLGITGTGTVSNCSGQYPVVIGSWTCTRL
jgi:hypothetical protein